MEFDGTIRSLTETHRRKKDEEVDKGKIVIMNKETDSVTIVASPDILDGWNPEEPVVVVLKRVQKTLKETTDEKKK